jgi:hypothetical protein
MMSEKDLLAENSNLKITVRILSEQIASLQQEILQLKKEVVEAALPRPKIAPSAIEPSDANIAKLAVGLKGNLHRNASRKKFISVARQIIMLHNNAGTATATDMKKASGLSDDGFSRQSIAVRKAGLTVRLPQKRFQLTGKSTEILNNVFG